MSITYSQLLEISDALKQRAKAKETIPDEGKFLTQDLTPEEHKALKKHMKSGDYIQDAEGAEGHLGSAHKKVFARATSNAYFAHCKHKIWNKGDERVYRSKLYRDSTDWEEAAQQDHADPALEKHYGV